MASSGVTIKLKSRGMKELLSSRAVERQLTELAEKVKARGKATAPVRTGAYRDSIHVESVQHPSRVVVRVKAGVSYGWAVEAMTGNLARALDAAK